MTKKAHTKFFREGNYLAEINVELIVNDDEWSPYLSLEDAGKLDELRSALRNKELEKAKKYGKIYLLKPIAV